MPFNLDLTGTRSVLQNELSQESNNRGDKKNEKWDPLTMLRNS